jgi:hypothetical protein
MSLTILNYHQAHQAVALSEQKAAMAELAAQGIGPMAAVAAAELADI